MMKMMTQLEADLVKEIANLETRRTLEIERAQQILTGAFGVAHMGHNLGAAANEITGFTNKIEQTQMILRDLRTRLEFATEGGAK